LRRSARERFEARFSADTFTEALRVLYAEFGFSPPRGAS
jgi:hypothetical protein